MALSSLTVDKCNRVAGGIKRLLVCDLSLISTIEFDVAASNHAIDNFEFTGSGAGAGFVEFTFKKGEARYESNTERQDNGVDVTTVNIFMNVPAPTSAQLYALEQLRDTCELVAVVQEFGSTTLLRVLGADQAEFGTLEFNSLNGGSGSVRTDANTFELNLMGMQEQPPFVLTETQGNNASPITDQDLIIAELLSPAAS